MSKVASTKLLEVYGYHAFREGQEEIIDALVDDGRDNLVIMPTGGGKSLCYQLPAMLLPHLTLVISPLIALMEDQVAALLQLGTKAATLHSGKSYEEKMATEAAINDGALKLLYIAPETMLQERMINFLKSKQISLIAIDEAHCVSVWGNDFRPEYTALKQLRPIFPDTPWVALTATADKATQDEMLNKLGLQNPKITISSFERENITITCLPGQRRIDQIKKFIINKEGQSGIIYCLSRKSTEKMSAKLTEIGIKAAYYHAGMDALSRSRIQERFQNDEIDVICATIAFGMGIDKSNVRYVIHFNLPKNVESYYQEIGRAGRDGLPAEAVLFYSWADVMQLRRFIDESEAKAEFKKVQHSKLDRIWDLASSFSCRTNFILNYFGEYRSKNCNHCDNCLQPPESFDGKIIAQKALSAITRCNQSATLSQIMDVLKGSYKEEIRQLGFTEVKTFGAGRDLSYPEWREYITQLVNLGLVSIDYTKNSNLLLTPLSKEVLTGATPVSLFAFQKKKTTPAKIKKEIEVEDDLFEILRKWRAGQARTQGIPAYTILHDKTLKELSSVKPTRVDLLTEIDGIGKAKKEKYGVAIIEIISNYKSAG